MIRLKRDSNRSLWLVLDQQGILDALSAFELAATATGSQMIIEMEKGVISVKNDKRTIRVVARIEIGDTSVISGDSQGIVWKIEQEDLESAINSLKRCKTDGYCAPPEFMRVQIPKNKRLDWLCCDIESPSNG